MGVPNSFLHPYDSQKSLNACLSPLAPVPSRNPLGPPKQHSASVNCDPLRPRLHYAGTKRIRHENMPYSFFATNNIPVYTMPVQSEYDMF